MSEGDPSGRFFYFPTQEQEQMSDLLANERTFDATPDGQSSRTSDQSQRSDVEQPSQEQVAKKDFLALQSKLDSQIAASKREAQAARQEAQQAQQWAQQLQQQLNQAEDKMAPDDYTRLELKVQRAEATAAQYYNAWQQQEAARQQEAAKMAILQEIVEDENFTLVKAEDLREANGTVAATKLALKLQREREKNKQQQDDDKAQRNTPDVGGGRPTTSSSKWDAEYDSAMKRKDSVALARLLREQEALSRRK